MEKPFISLPLLCLTATKSQEYYTYGITGHTIFSRFMYSKEKKGKDNSTTFDDLLSNMIVIKLSKYWMKKWSELVMIFNKSSNFLYLSQKSLCN